MSLFELPDEITALADNDQPIVVVNHEGAIVLFNEAAEKLWEISAEDIVGEFIEMLVPSNMRWGHQAYRRGYQAEPASREMDPGLDPHLEKSDGTLVPIHVWLEPHRVDGTLYVEAKVEVREEK